MRSPAPVRQEDRRQRNLEALVQGLESALPPRLRSGPPHRGHRRPAARRAGGPARRRWVSPPSTAPTRPLSSCALPASGWPSEASRSSSSTSPPSGALSASARPRRVPGAAPGTPRIYRPEGDPALAHRTAPHRPVAGTDPEELGELGAAWNEADLVLALVEVDPGIDLDIVRTWVNRVVPLVSAGRASGELLSTIAGLVATPAWRCRSRSSRAPTAATRRSASPTPVSRGPGRAWPRGAIAMTAPRRDSRRLRSRSGPAPCAPTPARCRGSCWRPGSRCSSTSSRPAGNPTVIPIPRIAPPGGRPGVARPRPGASPCSPTAVSWCARTSS